MINTTTGKLFYDKLGFTYIELLKFDKTEKELKTDLDKWLYAIKHMKTLKSKPASFTDPKLVKLFSIARYAKLTPEEKNMYNQSQKIRWDNQNALDYAEETGIETGEARGIEIGEARGKHEKAIEMAIEMLADKFPIGQIMKYTKLSEAEIKALQP